MTRETVFLALAAVCLGLLLLTVLTGPLGAVGAFLRRAVLGSLGIAAMGALFGTTVGVNLLTAAVVGFLGLPGFFALYLVQAIL